MMSRLEHRNPFVRKHPPTQVGTLTLLSKNVTLLYATTYILMITRTIYITDGGGNHGYPHQFRSSPTTIRWL